MSGGSVTTDRYIPSTSERAAQQVELYESTDGREGATMGGRPVVIVTHCGRKTGVLRKTPLMRVADGDGYVIVASLGGAPRNPLWFQNLREHPEVTLRDSAQVTEMRARLVEEPEERARLWALAWEAFPPYAEYQERTERVIPLFRVEPR
jgi:deazaflavin-dependent oxidoreductase (nitroreductase family)